MRELNLSRIRVDRFQRGEDKVAKRVERVILSGARNGSIVIGVIGAVEGPAIALGLCFKH